MMQLHQNSNLLPMPSPEVSQPFEQALTQGKAGESLLSKWLQNRGHDVFPAYKVEMEAAKGPQLFTRDGQFVLPDFLAFRDGKAIWFEAKTKSRFTWHRQSERWTTGLDLRHYKEYLQVSERTRLPVVLLFWHPCGNPSPADLNHGCPAACPTGLFSGQLNILRTRYSHISNKWGNSGMIYWDVSALHKIAERAEVEAL
jgi:hypothetical protein